MHQPEIRHGIPLLGFVLLLLSGPAFGQNTFTVNASDDSNLAVDSNPGDGVCEDARAGSRCTLRAAIEEANASLTFKTIRFALPFNIRPASPLPAITVPVLIDGRATPTYNTAAKDIADAPPRVFIDGADLGGATADGLRLRRGSRVYAIGIINFPDKAIDVDSGSSTDYLDGNWIGVNAAGGAAGNGTGIEISGSGTVVGGRSSNDGSPLGNVIAANSGFGVQILAGDRIEVLRNRIGTTPDGTGTRPNGAGGIEVAGSDNVIGARLAGNEIRYNAGPGVRVLGGSNRIRANLIDSNAGPGVQVNGTANSIGFASEDQKNRIENNGGTGILLGNATGASSSSVQNNDVVNNGGFGIDLQAGNNSTIDGNLVAANSGEGIRVTGNDVVVSANRIGFVNPSSPVLQPNAGNGVLVNGDRVIVRGNQIGGSDNGVRESIDVQSGDGVVLEDNWIGVTNTLQAIPNVGDGIRLRSVVTNARVEGNVIGFSADGVRAEASGGSFCDNAVGVSPPPSLTNIGNRVEGLRLLGNDNEVGRQASGCAGNYFGFNASDGIQLEGDDNTVVNNFLGGTDSASFGNGAGGLLLNGGAARNRVFGNVIRGNGNAGIRIASDAGQRNDLRGNEFRDNASGLGIDINTDGVTANDPGDDDEGPNRTMNTIEVLSSTSESDRVNVTFRIDSDTSNAAYPLSVDFYTTSGPGLAQGRSFLNGALYNATPGSSVVATVFINPALFQSITALVTDADGNTSEFSTPFTPDGPPPAVPSAPTGVSASDGLFLDRVQVSWNDTAIETRYQVFRCSTPEVSSCGGGIGGIGQNGTSFPDTGANADGRTHYYRIKACNDAGCSPFSGFDAGFRKVELGELILKDGFEG